MPYASFINRYFFFNRPIWSQDVYFFLQSILNINGNNYNMNTAVVVGLSGLIVFLTAHFR